MECHKKHIEKLHVPRSTMECHTKTGDEARASASFQRNTQIAHSDKTGMHLASLHHCAQLQVRISRLIAASSTDQLPVKYRPW